MKAAHKSLRTPKTRRLKQIRKESLSLWRKSRPKNLRDIPFFNKLRHKIKSAGRTSPTWSHGEIPLYGHIRLAVLSDFTGDREDNPTRDLIIEHLLGYRQIPVSVRRALRRHPKLFKFQSSLQYDLINYIHYLRASEANPDYEMLNKRLRACTARHRCGVIICPICKLEKREKLCERVYAEVKKTSSLDLKFATFFFGITDGDLHSVQRLQDSGIRRIRNVIEKYRIKGFDYFDSIWFVGMIENDFIPQYVIERPPSFRSWYGGRSVADRWWNLFYGLGYERRFEHSPILVTYHAIACIPKAKLVGRKFRTWPKTDYFSNVRRAELDAQKHNLAFFPVPYQIRFQPLREEQEISNAIDLLVTYVSKMNSAYTELEPDIDLSKPKKKPPRRGTRSLVLKGLKAKYLTPLSDPDMNERLKLIANKKFQNLKREINLGRKR